MQNTVDKHTLNMQQTIYKVHHSSVGFNIMWPNLAPLDKLNPCVQ